MTAKGEKRKAREGERRPSLGVHFLIKSMVKEIVNDSHKESSAGREMKP